MFGSLLKEERKRLKLTQAEAAGIASIERETWGRYEAGKLKPGADVLLAFANAGADVQYILTGVRSSAALAPDERLLLDKYRSSPQAVKDAALRVVMIGGEVQGGIVQHINSNQGQVAGKEIINNDTGVKGGKKPRGGSSS